MPSTLSSDAYAVFVEAVVAARRRQRVTQAELARRLGKPQSYVSKSERRQRRIDVVEFIAISEALGLDSADLFREVRRLLHAPLSR
ncbi:MAG: helix-turn-helix domain-containing protein [Caulobacteraceae bacterium]